MEQVLEAVDVEVEVEWDKVAGRVRAEAGWVVRLRPGPAGSAFARAVANECLILWGSLACNGIARSVV